MQANYLIPSENLDEFHLKVEKLNKRADKLNVPMVIASEPVLAMVKRQFSDGKGHTTWATVKQVTHKRYDDALVVDASLDLGDVAVTLDDRYKPSENFREYYLVNVSGQSPKHAGWTIDAVLVPVELQDGTVANLVNNVPGTPACPAEYRDRVGECDHCNTRRKRNETFVCRHESGKTMMVGRQCLKDFLGHTDPHSVARWAEYLAEFQAGCTESEEAGSGGRSSTTFSLDNYLAWTASSIRQTGWTSAKEAWESDYKMSTRDHVVYLLVRPFGNTDRWEKDREKYQPNEADRKLADEAIQWAEALTDESCENDYLYQLRLTVRMGHVVHRKGGNTGVAASMLQAYKRELGRKERATRPNEVIDPHAYPLSRKYKGRCQMVEMWLSVERCFPYQTDFGDYAWVSGVTDDGHAIKIKDGNDLLHEGDRVRIEARFQGEDEYKGYISSRLSHCKILERA